jgi:hypothetical protein
MKLPITKTTNLCFGIHHFENLYERGRDLERNDRKTELAIIFKKEI